MSISSKLREWIKSMIWTNKAEEEFGIELSNIEEANAFIDKCANVYKGKPEWIMNGELKTINMAKTICSEMAKLATLNIEVTVAGSARADYLQGNIDKIMPDLRRWVEYGCAYGEIILKPNGESIDIVYPNQYVVVEEFGTEIKGIVFVDEYQIARKYYSRLEYHRFDGDKYLISNRCFVGSTRYDFSKRIDIKETRWKDLAEDVTAEGVEKMLFGVFKTPAVNNYDMTRKGMPVFGECLTEIEDLDVAYSRFAREIFDSKRTVLLDSDRLLASGGKIGTANKDALVKGAGLPDYIKLIEGNGTNDIYHEINPNLNTDVRLKGIDALLSQVGFKAGFSNGYFVFDEKTGMVTATQVESDDRRTIQTIADIRKQLESCLDGVIYALDKFADAYNMAPAGTYEITYEMADITENHEEDKARWLSYVQMGLITFALYLEKFEGYSEEEAKRVAQQAKDERMREALQGEMLYGGLNQEDKDQKDE